MTHTLTLGTLNTFFTQRKKIIDKYVPVSIEICHGVYVPRKGFKGEGLTKGSKAKENKRSSNESEP